MMTNETTATPSPPTVDGCIREMWRCAQDLRAGRMTAKKHNALVFNYSSTARLLIEVERVEEQSARLDALEARLAQHGGALVLRQRSLSVVAAAPQQPQLTQGK